MSLEPLYSLNQRYCMEERRPRDSQPQIPRGAVGVGSWELEEP